MKDKPYFTLPLQLDSTATDEYGLFYVYPIGGRYVAVNSGLPWWTSTQEQGLPFVPSAQRVLTGFKDFILFKESMNNVVAEGYFNHQWELPAEAAEKMEASGVVERR